MKYIVILILVFLAVRLIKKALSGVVVIGPGGRPGPRGPGPGDRVGPSGPADAEMVQDPVCGSYVPVDGSITARVEGRTIHFCSTECRDEYLEKTRRGP